MTTAECGWDGARDLQVPDPELVRTVIRATFDAAAEFFDASPLRIWDEVGARTVDVGAPAPGARVLDVCCGTGASALPATERVGSAGWVTGVDLAERPLARARLKARSRGLGNVGFVAGDMAKLGVPDAAVDVVLCVFGLYLALDIPAALRELARTLRGGGTLVVTTWGRRILEPAASLFFDAVAQERPDLDLRSVMRWSYLDSPEAVTSAFRSAGLPVPVILEETVIRPVDPDGFWTLMLGSGYRLVLELMGSAAAARVRAGLYGRMESSAVREVAADVMYARVTKP